MGMGWDVKPFKVPGSKYKGFAVGTGDMVIDHATWLDPQNIDDFMIVPTLCLDTCLIVLQRTGFHGQVTGLGIRRYGNRGFFFAATSRENGQHHEHEKGIDPKPS